MTNVVIFHLDDVRYDQYAFMPNARRLFDRSGTTFTGARHNTALCQPARIGLLTGQLSKHHNVLNRGALGYPLGEPDHDNTWARWLSDAGVRCGHIGKYTNFPFYRNFPKAPAGWSTWRFVYIGESPAPGGWSVADGTGERLEDLPKPDAWQDDYIRDESLRFIEGPEPWCLIINFNSAHLPWNPHPEDLFAWSWVEWPIVDEEDMSDKPPWMRFRAPHTPQDISALRAYARAQLRELNQTDRTVAAVADRLEALGVMNRTTMVLTSDNGINLGEHRLPVGGKGGPYDHQLRVPLVARGEGFPATTVDAPVYPMQDLTATLVDIFGAEPGLPHQTGTSLREIAAEPQRFEDRVLLHEIGGPELNPGDAGWPVSGDGVTTGPRHPTLPSKKLYRYPSVRVGGGSELTYELYDLAADPNELQNLAGDSSARTLRDQLERELDSLLS